MISMNMIMELFKQSSAKLFMDLISILQTFSALINFKILKNLNAKVFRSKNFLELEELQYLCS